MNDCMWLAIGLCDGHCKCKNYVSLNSDEGHKLREEYEGEINPVIDVVAKNFAKRNGYVFKCDHKYKALDINTGKEVVGYYWTNEAGNHFIRVTEKDEEYEGINIKKIVCDDIEIARRTLEKL